MLRSIRIGHIKSFSEPQTLALSEANGKLGSGYNVLVGANNSGKSTIVSLVRQLLAPDAMLTIGREMRREPEKPVIEAVWIHPNGDIAEVGIDTSAQGGIFRKTGNHNGLHGCFRFVPSRRPFASDYQVGGMSPSDYEYAELLGRLGSAAYFDGQLATAVARVFLDGLDKGLFLAELMEVDPSSVDFTTDNVGGRNVMLYVGPSKRPHAISETGDGVTNLIRIIYALATSRPGDCIVVDEPELSLHPQLQRNLYRLLLRYSDTRQLLVVTHSPHFVGWPEISGPSKLFRAFIDSVGNTQVASPASASFNAVNAHSNVMSRKYYDSVCKELFFSSRAVLLEGAEDAHYIENFLEATEQPPLPIMGYGCGGASVIRPWMRLCVDLGIKCAAIFDGDKKSEYEAAVNEFADKADYARPFFLIKDDIRDKYERNLSGGETNKVIKEGVFRRDGVIHLPCRDAFQIFIDEVRKYLD